MQPEPIFSEVGDVFLERPKPRDVLDRCNILQGLSPESKSELLAQCHLAYADRDETLWTGSAPARFFIVISGGLLCVKRRSPGGGSYVVNILGDGAWAGVLQSSGAALSPFTAVALSNLWYLKVPFNAWQAAKEQEPQVREVVISELSARLQSSLELVHYLGTGTTEQRLAMTVVKVAEAIQSTSKTWVKLPLTATVLSDLIGTPLAAVLKVLHEWRSEGWFDIGVRSMHLIDSRPLKKKLPQAFPESL